MKKLTYLLLLTTIPFIQAQEISDALLYSQDEIQGSARFRALSGAFGALGGDMSAVSLNPAGSAIFSKSSASVSLNSINTNNDVGYFNSFNTSSNSDVDLNQTGVVFVFKNNNIESPWRKFALSFAYDNFQNFENNWVASGTSNTSIDSYFLAYADGLRLDEISRFDGETYTDAYVDIGSVYGYGHQQAFLGFESFILEPLDINNDVNTQYTSNIASGSFDQNYAYSATGYNGKFTFNLGAQYGENLYLGINLNSHFVNYDRVTFLTENNNNVGSLVNQVRFENVVNTTGTGFSFQLGGIYKVDNNLRLGFTYNSPTWQRFDEEATQFISTVRDDAGVPTTLSINPQIISIFPQYKLQTPGKLTGSLAYIFGDKGLLSFDYSVKDYSSIKFKPTSDSYFSSLNNIISDTFTTANTYRIGGEYRYKQLSFRGGYRFEEGPYKNSDSGELTGYSAGLGYNFGNTKLDLTYDYANRTIDQQLYSVGLTNPANLDITNSNITLSLSFTL